MSGAPVLKTARLLLRPWVDADVDAWAALNADPRVMEFFPSTYDRARSERTAAAMRQALVRDGYGWWAVEVLGGAAFAGVVALSEVPFDAPFTSAFEIGWRFAHAYWGQGYATEGARAALTFAFDVLGREQVVAMTALPNHRSQRVMQRLGLQHDVRDDFDNPRLEAGHRLRRHVLYRLGRAHWATLQRGTA